MKAVYIALGSNISPRIFYLRKGVWGIKNIGVRIKKISSIYRTSPVGNEDQPYFLNAVLLGETQLSPLDLLTKLQEIEKECGRVRKNHGGPRTLDLDLLLYDKLQLKGAKLILPHPRMHERKFVLFPLLEIAPRLCSPLGIPYRKYLAQLDSKQKIRRYRHQWVS
jgi:2-amino-4-hydroxy-6-hydroxymethyldihydropteridine diphosphokinase